MLQFWKKTGHDDKHKHIPSNKPEIIKNDTFSSSFDSVKSSPVKSFDDDGLFDVDELDNVKQRSRLSKTLQEVLLDKDALSHFIQFMENRSASNYILCYLDIENFKTDWTQWRNTTIIDKNNHEQHSLVPSLKVDHDSLSISTDCDSLTADLSISYDNSTNTNDNNKVTQNSIIQFNNMNNSCCDNKSDITTTSTNIPSENNINIEQLIENALMIFKKYIAQEATITFNIKCPEQLRNDLIENICSHENIMKGDCFDQVQSFVFDVMDKDYFEGFMSSDYYCKHQIDVLTSGNVVLDDILYNETALFYFMEFLEQENCTNLLEFWIAATNFQQQLNNQKEFFDPVEAQSDAVVLYDKYFSLQAHCPLGLGDKVRFAVEQSICGENGLIIDCFHLPLKIVEKILDNNYLKPFLDSQLFYKYLSELINAVETNSYFLNLDTTKKSNQSDCSSEKSFSTNSTLFLALDLNRHNKCNTKKNKEKSANMSIDIKELSDPNSLWKKRRSHILSCGRVTALGKFETDLEPEPDRKEFRLKNVMKKFVSFDEDKKKEEMAWQVAEMIVKDITNITLNQGKTGEFSFE